MLVPWYPSRTFCNLSHGCHSTKLARWRGGNTNSYSLVPTTFHIYNAEILYLFNICSDIWNLRAKVLLVCCPYTIKFIKWIDDNILEDIGFANNIALLSSAHKDA